jgi:hypothetical protein
MSRTAAARREQGRHARLEVKVKHALTGIYNWSSVQPFFILLRVHPAHFLTLIRVLFHKLVLLDPSFTYLQSSCARRLYMSTERP